MNLESQPVPVKEITLLKALRGYGHLFKGGAQHPGPSARHQLDQTAGVIGVVVRD
jgi:hypothetical protein